MLTYEEELELSDFLVLRRRITDTLKEEDRDPDPDEQEDIEKGNKAATDLVEAYLPKIGSIAKSIITRSSNVAASSITMDELINEGVIAALRTTNSFNARGKKKGHPGVRFGTYCNMAVAKSMSRYIAQLSSPMRLDISVIQDTWIWMAVKEDLRTELGREPSIEEIEERSGKSVEGIEPDLPHRASFMDTDHPETREIQDNKSQSVALVGEYAASAERAVQVFGEVFAPHLVNVMSLYFGFDRMYPRMFDDLADEMGISKKKAKDEINLVESVMIHPKYRVKLKRSIEAMKGQPGFDIDDEG